MKHTATTVLREIFNSKLCKARVFERWRCSASGDTSFFHLFRTTWNLLFIQSPKLTINKDTVFLFADRGFYVKFSDLTVDIGEMIISVIKCDDNEKEGYSSLVDKFSPSFSLTNFKKYPQDEGICIMDPRRIFIEFLDNEIACSGSLKEVLCIIDAVASHGASLMTTQSNTTKEVTNFIVEFTEAARKLFQLIRQAPEYLANNRRTCFMNHLDAFLTSTTPPKID